MVDRGYVVIPVIGKAPPFARWQKIESVSRSMLEAWGKNFPRANSTGILTRLTPTLDADILNEPAAIAIEDAVIEIGAGRARFFHLQDLIAADPEVAVGDLAQYVAT